MTRTIESSAGQIGADIQRLGVSGNASVIVFISDDDKEDDFVSCRNQVRPLVEAEGLSDDDIDDLIEEARKNTKRA